jgi:hypothetical protein
MCQQQMRSAVLRRGERIQKAHFEPSSEPRDRPYADGVEPKFRDDIMAANLNVCRPRGPGVVAAGKVRVVVSANHQYGKAHVLYLRCDEPTRIGRDVLVFPQISADGDEIGLVLASGS